jgi:hypothetical protein
MITILLYANLLLNFFDILLWEEFILSYKNVMHDFSNFLQYLQYHYKY